MNTGKAIEKVKNLNEILCEETISDIVSALKRGKVYEQIVNHLEKEKGLLYYGLMGKKTRPLHFIIEEIKQKYLPKPKPQVWKQFFGVDFADGESIMVKITVTKELNGNIIIAPVITEPEKGGET